MGKQIKLTEQGHRVMGALATFIVPKLAADQSLQSVELEAVCKSIKPDRYDRQLNGIIGTVKERFGSRLAQDENLEGLSKILAALMPADLALDKKAEDEDEDSAEDETGEDSFADFMKTKKAKDSFADFIKSKKKAKDAKNEDEEDKDAKNEDEEDKDAKNEDEEDEDAKNEDEERAKDKKAKDKADNDADLDNKEDDMKVGKGDRKAKDAAMDMDAMDAKLDAARTEGADLAMRRLQARYEAAELVKPIIGKVNPLAQDATSIYKLALDAKGADLTGVPRVAFKAVLQTLLKAEAGKKPKFAQDKAITKTLTDEFPNAPGLA